MALTGVSKLEAASLVTYPPPAWLEMIGEAGACTGSPVASKPGIPISDAGTAGCSAASAAESSCSSAPGGFGAEAAIAFENACSILSCVPARSIAASTLAASAKADSSCACDMIGSGKIFATSFSG